MYFSENHVWMSPIHSNVVKMGLSAIMRENLGEIIHVDLPSVEKLLKSGDILALLESSKAAIEVLTPLEGSVLKINEALKEDSEFINLYPEGEGWLVILKLPQPFSPENFLSREKYESSNN
ncbi:glycine cleavage protein H-like protein [Chlamydiifrater phoenicopteri]|uniref:glycine cleavage protein H-like protein n=1 Tax=Chlamydiifrater phoenicopteri TaxID=2681469 RepID=UPI001BCD3E25|nr:glycine cleavage protein H-like protein [Chlamydiifrater phoenicopteri]